MFGVCVCACMHACVWRADRCMHVCMCVCVHIMCVRTCVCVYICVRACMCGFLLTNLQALCLLLP